MTVHPVLAQCRFDRLDRLDRLSCATQDRGPIRRVELAIQLVGDAR